MVTLWQLSPPPQSRVFPCRVWFLQGYPFGCPSCVASWIILWCNLNPIISCIGSGSFGRISGAGQCQILSVTGFGLHVWRYKVIFSLCLPLLGLSAHVRGQAVYQGQASTSSQPSDRSAKSTQKSTFTFLMSVKFRISSHEGPQRWEKI